MEAFETSQRQQPLVLVVDDSMLIRHTVCRYMEERGVDVHSACNGVEAWNLLKSIRPDLIVTDLSMPKMNGAELVAAIKADAELRNTPIILLSSRKWEGGVTPADVPADFYIQKDIDIQHQLSRVMSTVFQERESPVDARD